MTARASSFRSLSPIVAGFLLALVAAGTATWLWFEQQQAAVWVQHTLEVENRLSTIRVLMADAETGQRGFLLTGRKSYLTPYSTAKLKTVPEIEALSRQIADNPRQQRLIGPLRTSIDQKLLKLEEALKLREGGDQEQALAVINTDAGQRLMLQARDLLGQMTTEERRLFATRSARVTRLNEYGLGALVLSILIVLGLALLAIGDARRRLAAVIRTNDWLETERSERIRAESQVRQLQKIEAIGQLTGGIAHDFNNMLAIIVGSLDLARRKLSGDEHPNILKYIENAQEGAQRAASLTARLLAFSRQQPLAPKVLDANKVVSGMSELLRRTIGEPVHIETVLAGGLWRICADPGQIESVLVNLCVNARDAMPEGGQLTIETANTDLDDRYARDHSEVVSGQYVMISITDTGIGMTAETIERAFEPFYTTKEVGKGTGLGLSQAFGFVKQSSGHLKIYSELGHGTSIKVYLPRYTGNDAVIEAREVKAAGLPKGSRTEIVLVVEDETQVRHISVDALRELGYTVVQAASPYEALQQLELQPSICLLFTDIIMPDMNGRQLADLAVKQRPDLKVLYTTGYTRNAVVHNGTLDSGINFLAKPFTIEQLALKIRDVLGA